MNAPAETSRTWLTPSNVERPRRMTTAELDERLTAIETGIAELLARDQDRVDRDSWYRGYRAGREAQRRGLNFSQGSAAGPHRGRRRVREVAVDIGLGTGVEDQEGV